MPPFIILPDCASPKVSANWCQSNEALLLEVSVIVLWYGAYVEGGPFKAFYSFIVMTSWLVGKPHFANVIDGNTVR
jgi:hypothetical protein